jgi:hypothetical protein
MATVQRERGRPWMIESGWLYLNDAISVVAYLLLGWSGSSMFTLADGNGNQPLATAADHLAFWVLTIIGGICGGIAATHFFKHRRFSTDRLTEIARFSALCGIGLTPGVFWYTDWPYRAERIAFVAFTCALSAEILKNAVVPAVQATLPAIIEGYLKARAGNGATWVRNGQADSEVRKPDDADVRRRD